jgi:hypothetical protein
MNSSNMIPEVCKLSITDFTPSTTLQQRVMIVAFVNIQLRACFKLSVALDAEKVQSQSLFMRLQVLTHICLSFVLVGTALDITGIGSIIRVVSDMVSEVEEFCNQ